MRLQHPSDMPIDNYGVWKVRPVHYSIRARPKDGLKFPQFVLYFQDGDEDSVDGKLDQNGSSWKWEKIDKGRITPGAIAP